MIHINDEAARCLLCEKAPCGEKTARALRALRFENLWTARELFDQLNDAEIEAAEKACIHYDRPIRIAELKKSISPKDNMSSISPKDGLPSLELNFCDMVCENPFFLASSAICTNYEMVARALEAGWAGVFYKTICKQDIREVSPRFDAVRKEGTPFVGFRNMEQLSENPYDVDFDILHRLKVNYPQYEEDAYALARHQLGNTDLDIISSAVGLQNICIVATLRQGGGKNGLLKLFDILNGHTSENNELVELTYQQAASLPFMKA